MAIVFTVSRYKNAGLEHALGGRNHADVAWVEFSRYAQGTSEGFEHGFALVVCVLALEVVYVYGGQGVVDEALKEFTGQVHVEFTDMRACERQVVEQARATREVDNYT